MRIGEVVEARMVSGNTTASTRRTASAGLEILEHGLDDDVARLAEVTQAYRRPARLASVLARSALRRPATSRRGLQHVSRIAAFVLRGTARCGIETLIRLHAALRGHLGNTAPHGAETWRKQRPRRANLGSSAKRAIMILLYPCFLPPQRHLAAWGPKKNGRRAPDSVSLAAVSPASTDPELSRHAFQGFATFSPQP